ncbi:fatty-acid--CoA ligase [Nocardia sp. NPDC004278]
MAKNPEVLAAIEQGAAAADGKLSRVEQIKKCIVLPEVREPGSDVLTATGKLERTPIAARYPATIERLYS